MVDREVHVLLSTRGRWQVLRDGNKRPTATFDTQEEALAVAREMARKAQTKLVIYNVEGRVRRTHSYLPR